VLVSLQPLQKILERVPAVLVRDPLVITKLSSELTSFLAIPANTVGSDPVPAAHTAAEIEGMPSHFESDSKCVLILARSCPHSRWYGCNCAARGATQ
jgi:hypothetical protein